MRDGVPDIDVLESGHTGDTFEFNVRIRFTRMDAAILSNTDLAWLVRAWIMHSAIVSPFRCPFSISAFRRLFLAEGTVWPPPSRQ